jgi:hypothetical protein
VVSSERKLVEELSESQEFFSGRGKLGCPAGAAAGGGLLLGAGCGNGLTTDTPGRRFQTSDAEWIFGSILLPCKLGLVEAET